MKTFGEFFDEMITWAKETHNLDAEMLMEEWNEIADGDPEGMTHEQVIAENRAQEMNQRLASFFCSEMVWIFRERLQGICGEQVYADTIRAGHGLLDELAARLKNLGFDVVRETDVGLTISDGLARAPDKVR